MYSVRNERKSKREPAAIRAAGAGPDRGPLRLLLLDDGGSELNDALALTEALARSTDIEVIAIAADRAADVESIAPAEDADIIVLSGKAHPARPPGFDPDADAKGLLDGAPCAALVVPPGLAETDFSLGTIAVGYDGSRASATAVDRATDLAERTGASILILGAVEISIGVAGYETRQPKDLERMRMEGHLRHAVEGVPSTVYAESRLLFGHPGRALVEAVDDADLLVLGSRGGYTPQHRLALGDVATEVLRGTPVPTLVTPDS